MKGMISGGAAIVLLLAACATPIAGERENEAADEAAVRATIKDLADAFSVGDGEKVASLASRDMHLIHPLRGDVTYEDFTTAVRTGMKPRTNQTTIAELDHFYYEGDLAITNITWRTRIVESGGSVRLRGERDQEVWRREADGKWRLFRGASFPLDLAKT